MQTQQARFAKFAVFVLVFTIFVILWGGFVSASGAGDGCGEAWPLCESAAERTATPMETFIELFHRGTSGISLLLVVVMFVRGRRLYPKRHAVRTAVFWSLVFMLGEAAIGALIVIFGLVAESESLARAFTQPLHLVNTYLLLGFLTLTVYYARGNPAVPIGRRRVARLFGVALAGVLLVSAFGTLASLASTIFPSQTFLDGVRADFSADSHYLIRLRVWHPIIATAVGVYLIWLVRRVRTPQNDTLGTAVLILFGAQYALGALTAILLTPIVLSLLHLLISDLIWMGLIWLGAEALRESSPQPSPVGRGSRTPPLPAGEGAGG